MTLFGTSSQAHKPAHSFQYCWYTFVVDPPDTPDTT